MVQDEVRAVAEDEHHEVVEDEVHAIIVEDEHRAVVEDEHAVVDRETGVRKLSEGTEPFERTQSGGSYIVESPHRESPDYERERLNSSDFHSEGENADKSDLGVSGSRVFDEVDLTIYDDHTFVPDFEPNNEDCDVPGSIINNATPITTESEHAIVEESNNEAVATIQEVHIEPDLTFEEDTPSIIRLNEMSLNEELNTPKVKVTAKVDIISESVGESTDRRSPRRKEVTFKLEKREESVKGDKERKSFKHHKDEKKEEEKRSLRKNEVSKYDARKEREKKVDRKEAGGESKEKKVSREDVHKSRKKGSKEIKSHEQKSKSESSSSKFLKHDTLQLFSTPDKPVKVGKKVETDSDQKRDEKTEKQERKREQKRTKQN